MAKRVRGLELESETGCAPLKSMKQHTLAKGSKGSQSQLANKLLALWSHGLISASLCQELADLAMQDGAQHDELYALASTGNHGMYKGNIHRDLMAYFCKDLIVAPSMTVDVPCIDPKTNKDTIEGASIFLPHLQFWSLGLHFPENFNGLFSLAKGLLPSFWDQVEAVKDPVLESHPLKKGALKKDWKAKTMPIILHGDGVEYQNRDSIMVWSWAPLLNQKNSLQSHQLLASFPKSCSTTSTFTPIWEWLLWSFTALAKGFHPKEDPFGKPLKKGIMAELAGHPLHCQGYRAVIWSILGDNEFFSNTLLLPHWASHFPCWNCDAQNFAESEEGKHVKQIRMDLQKFQLVTHAEALKKAHETHAKALKKAEGDKTLKKAEPLKKDTIHPVFLLPGCSSQMVKGDCLHILFTRGLYGHLMGGILHYMIYYEGPGKTCAVSPQDRLSLIFKEIQENYALQKASTRLTNLKLSMLCDPKKPHATYPTLDTKGGEGKHLAPCFLPVVQKAFAKSTEAHELKMVEALEAITCLVTSWDDAGLFLKKKEFETSMLLAEKFLNSYDYLHRWALEKGRKLFNVVHKHHSFLHLVQSCQFFNPKATTTFRGEDFVGHISKMSHSVSFGVRATKLSQKLTPKYQVLCHLLKTRTGFELHSTKIFE